MANTMVVIPICFNIGHGIGRFIPKTGSAAKDMEFMISPLLMVALSLAAFFLQAVSHEARRLVFGLFSGYQFNFFRIGNLMITSIKGELKIRGLSIARTAAFMKKMKNFPSVLRWEYAMELLVRKDEKAAAQTLTRFEKVARSHQAKRILKAGVDR